MTEQKVDGQKMLIVYGIDGTEEPEEQKKVHVPEEVDLG